MTISLSTQLIRALSLTTLAMIAFAGNSVLCRMALQDGAIDAATFTSARLVAGALMLAIILVARTDLSSALKSGSWLSAASLFVYAIFFSYAYIDLGAGAGALILFGLVQATMIAAAFAAGERPGGIEVTGWIVALSGMAYLLLPGANAPSPGGALLMAVAGISWGIYSIRGRAEADPLASTAGNFLRSLVFVPLLLLLSLRDAHWSAEGVWLAVFSGAITSGLGYVLWYAALRYLRTLQAALVQLSVPAIAALGGVLLLEEALTFQLTLSAVLILGGISVALMQKKAPG